MALYGSPTLARGLRALNAYLYGALGASMVSMGLRGPGALMLALGLLWVLLACIPQRTEAAR